MNEKRSTIIKYAVAGLIGLVIAACYIFSNNVFKQQDATEIMKIICDGFSVGGLLLLLSGLLTFCNKNGVFDGIGYSFEIVFISRNWSRKRKFEDRRSFADYREEKAKKRSTSWFLVIVGGIELAIALLFLGLYYLV